MELVTLSHWLFLLTVLSSNISQVNCQEHTAEKTDTTPAFLPEELFQDMFPLTSENFTSTVLRTKDPWIVIFHDGMLHRTWKTMATQLRGLVWVGIVDVRLETELVENLGHVSSRGIARVYPYGQRLYKERNWKYVTSEDGAKTATMTSFPDIVNEVDGEDIEDVLTDAYMSKPSRFPAFLILDNEHTPPVFEALALRFRKYFLFSKLVDPSKSDLEAFGLGDMELNFPELFILLTSSGEVESAKALRFNPEQFGGMNYTEVMEFLFSVNNNFRHELPGSNMADSQQEAEMADVIEMEGKRFEIVRGIDDRIMFQKKYNAGNRGKVIETDNIRFKVTTETGIRDEL